MSIRKQIQKGVFAILLSAVSIPLFAAEQEIECSEKKLVNHVQGIAADKSGIYWSFTDLIIKTDYEGKKIVSVVAPKHTGDLCIDGDGIINVSVGQNVNAKEDGSDSMIYRYDSNLKLIEKIKLPPKTTPDGITWLNGKYYICPDEFGAPKHDKNSILVYDSKFNFVRKLPVDIGTLTQYGIQTLNVLDGKLIAGFYAWPNTWLLDPETGKTIKSVNLPVNTGFCEVPRETGAQPGTVFNCLSLGKYRDHSAKILVHLYKDGKFVRSSLK